MDLGYDTEPEDYWLFYQYAITDIGTKNLQNRHGNQM